MKHPCRNCQHKSPCGKYPCYALKLYLNQQAHAQDQGKEVITMPAPEPTCCVLCRCNTESRYYACEDPCQDYKNEMAARAAASVTAEAVRSSNAIKAFNEREALRDD